MKAPVTPPVLGIARIFACMGNSSLADDAHAPTGARDSGADYVFVRTSAADPTVELLSCDPVSGGALLRGTPVKGWNAAVHYTPDLGRTPLSAISAACPYPQNGSPGIIPGVGREGFFRIELQQQAIP